MQVECKDCGISMDAGCRNNARTCPECRKLRAAEANTARCRRRYAENPERERARRREWSRRQGVKPLDAENARRRERLKALEPTVQSLLNQGRTYTQIGIELGLTRNAVAGVVHRLRRLAEGVNHGA